MSNKPLTSTQKALAGISGIMSSTTWLMEENRFIHHLRFIVGQDMTEEERVEGLHVYFDEIQGINKGCTVVRNGTPLFSVPPISSGMTYQTKDFGALSNNAHKIGDVIAGDYVERTICNFLEEEGNTSVHEDDANQDIWNNIIKTYADTLGLKDVQQDIISGGGAENDDLYPDDW